MPESEAYCTRCTKKAREGSKIIQPLESENKELITNPRIPGGSSIWAGEHRALKDELKLFLGEQSRLEPIFATLISSLLSSKAMGGTENTVWRRAVTE